MARVRMIALMILGPPLLWLIWAHLMLPIWDGPYALGVIFSASAGLLGIATSRLDTIHKLVLAPLYSVGVVLVAPMFAIFAACSAGHCL